MDLKRSLAASGVEKGRTHPYLSNKELSSKQDRAPPPQSLRGRGHSTDKPSVTWMLSQTLT